MVKKSYLEEYFKTNRNTGIAALNVKEGDEVVDIIFQDEEDMVLITKLGMSIRFDTKSIGAIGRVAMGVKGVKLADGDEVVAALPVHKETDQVAVFTETGLGKKVALDEFPVQGRGGKGTYVYKPTAQTGNLVSAAMVSDEDNILLCGNYSSICISATEIPLIGKTGMGNTLIKNNRVMSVLKL
jgi:DNA gyrase subunit A